MIFVKQKSLSRGGVRTRRRGIRSHSTQHSGTNMVVFLKQERLIRARPDPFSIRSEVNPQPKLNLSRRAEGEYARAHPDAVDIVISVSCPIDGTG